MQRKSHCARADNIETDGCQHPGSAMSGCTQGDHREIYVRRREVFLNDEGAEFSKQKITFCNQRRAQDGGIKIQIELEALQVRGRGIDAGDDHIGDKTTQWADGQCALDARCYRIEIDGEGDSPGGI